MSRQISAATLSSENELTHDSAVDARIDAQLVNRFNSGDANAFDLIVNRYRARIYGLVHGMLKNTSDAEEITQDTFIRAYRALGRFRGDSSLATWLHRIAVNLARNRYWYFFRRRRHAWMSLEHPIGEEGDATFSDLVAAPSNDPAQTAALGEFNVNIADCLARLEKPHREILLMRTEKNLSYDEIAEILRINVGTVKSRIARARENLRALLVAECPEFGCCDTPSDFFLAARSLYGSPAMACA